MSARLFAPLMLGGLPRPMMAEYCRQRAAAKWKVPHSAPRALRTAGG